MAKRMIGSGGTITTGGTAQSISRQNGNRTGFMFVNTSDTVMYVNELGIEDVNGTITTNLAAADNISMKVLAGATYTSPELANPMGAISVFCATTGKTYTLREW